MERVNFHGRRPCRAAVRRADSGQRRRAIRAYLREHRFGPYEARPVTWFKVLNPAYTQKRGRRELFERFGERRAGADATAADLA